MQRLPLHSGISVLTSKFILSFYCLFALNWHFWWGNGVKGPIMITFWCLMPKGEKLRPKQMDQLPLENFENSRVRIFWFVQNTLIAKFGLLWGRISMMGKGGVFGTWSIFPLEYLSLCLNKWVWLRDRKMNLICKNKPSGGKEWSKYAKLESKTIWSLFASMLHVLHCFVMCWHKSAKRGRLKGKCALGPFLQCFGD